MDIRMMSLEYSFDAAGKTECVSALFNGNEDKEYINARVCVKPEDLAEGQDIDDLSRKQLEKLARARLEEVAKVVEEPAEKGE